MIIAYNYFHPMINEYQGADDKGMTKSLSLVPTLQTLINYSFDRLNFFLRQRTARKFVPWDDTGFAARSTLIFFLPSFIDMINK